MRGWPPLLALVLACGKFGRGVEEGFGPRCPKRSLSNCPRNSDTDWAGQSTARNRQIVETGSDPPKRIVLRAAATRPPVGAPGTKQPQLPGRRRRKRFLRSPSTTQRRKACQICEISDPVRMFQNTTPPSPSRGECPTCTFFGFGNPITVPSTALSSGPLPELHFLRPRPGHPVG